MIISFQNRTVFLFDFVEALLLFNITYCSCILLIIVFFYSYRVRLEMITKKKIRITPNLGNDDNIWSLIWVNSPNFDKSMIWVWGSLVDISTEEAVTGGALKLVLKSCRLATLSTKRIRHRCFPGVLLHFWEHLFHRIPPDDCFCKLGYLWGKFDISVKFQQEATKLL